MFRLIPLLFSFFLLLTSSMLWAAGGGAHHTGIPKWQIIFAVTNFLLLVLLLFLFLRKPMKEFFASRSLIIEKEIKESQELKNEAQAKYQQYEAKLKNIEAEMQKMIEELKKDGDLEKQNLIQTATEQAQSLQQTHQVMMNQELKKAKEELKQEAVNLAAELAEKIVKQQLKAEDQQRIIQEYLEKMEKLG